MPSLHQSAGVTVLGSITKQGSRWLRRNMVEVAHCAVRVRGCRFRALFLRVRAKKGSQTAYVAVARKMLTVVCICLLMARRTLRRDSQRRLLG